MKAWIDAVTRLGGDAAIAREAADELVRRYSEKHRRYHDLRHANSVATDADALARELGIDETDRAVITLAACAHDVVYGARPGEDERLSAAWAVRWLSEAGVPTKTVERLILTTITHEAPPDDLLATALLDADLAILGAAPPTYDAYATNVRHEYSAVDDQAWTTGRAKVVSTLLHREALYRSAPAKARWDAPARRNLTRELTRLRGARNDQ